MKLVRKFRKNISFTFLAPNTSSGSVDNSDQSDRYLSFQETARKTDESSESTANQKHPLRMSDQSEEMISTTSECQHESLSLSHLKKAFDEYLRSFQSFTDCERCTKLFNLLPLFCKVFGLQPTSEILEKFNEGPNFCRHLTKLFIVEVGNRASNQRNEIASENLQNFLRIHTNIAEESNYGWMLLSSLCIFAFNHQMFIEIMIENSLPSTLVKCMYLFLDLPTNRTDENCQNSKNEDIRLFQKTFYQLLIKLCNYRLASEDLIVNDVFTLLFHAVTSSCSNENAIWRKYSSDVLTTTSRCGLTASVINYIHNKNSMLTCVSNLKHFMDIDILETVDMLLTLFCFLNHSSNISPVLLEDFKNAKGYIFLEHFLLSFEINFNDNESNVHDVMRHMTKQIACLVTYGYKELNVTKDCNNLMYKLTGFSLPQSRNDSTSVRNIYAFKVLQSCFLKTKSTFLSCVILESITNIFNLDYANYFVLESERTLPQLIECIHLKSDEVQLKIFSLIEFLVFELKYVPFTEFISIVIFLRTHVFEVPKCGQYCINTLISIIASDSIFKQIFREVGLIEVCVSCLQYFRDLLENRCSKDSEPEPELYFDVWCVFCPIILNCVRLLLSNSEDNIAIFNKYSGSKLIQDFVSYDDYRIYALEVIYELVISSNKSDELLTFLLSALNTHLNGSIEAQNQLLVCLIFCLKHSHRTRIFFRKNDGFLNMLNILMTLDDYLVCDKMDRNIVIVLRNIFRVISTTMKNEPGNAKYFHTNFITTKCLRDILKCLKCFSANIEDHHVTNESFGSFQENIEVMQYFRKIFLTIDPNFISNQVPFYLTLIIIIYRLLYDLLLDKFKAVTCESLLSLLSPGGINKQFRAIDLSLDDNKTVDKLIIHPGILITMFELTMCLQNSDTQTLHLQIFLSNTIKTLMRSERNQQIMCQNDFVNEILTLAEPILTNEKHPLHNIYQSIFERLASQFLSSKDLRQFFRLGNPLFCLPIDATEKTGGKMSLSRLKSLVTMATPKEFFRNNFTSNSASFVEFNMSLNGYAAIFLPSLAPQIQVASNVLTAAVNDSTTIFLCGGTGYADRTFPPSVGFSFSTWFFVDKFSDKDIDPHPIRLLNIFKTNNKHNQDSNVCFSLFLSCLDKSVIVSTLELNMLEVKNFEFMPLNENIVKFVITEIKEKAWHHLVVVLNRSVLKNSTVFLYFDGELVNYQSIAYICPNNSDNTDNDNTQTSLFAYIGTPSLWKRISNLCWRQGHCFLFEEVLLQQTIAIIYRLGPYYIGSLQAIKNNQNEYDSNLITEEKISFAINPFISSEMNVNKIKKIYSRTDYKAIVKHLNISTNDNLVSVRILHNTVAHLPGPIRTLGGITIGYLSCRLFVPQPVTSVINSIGGSAVLLGLIAMSQNADSLYAAVKSLVCVVQANCAIEHEMDKNNYYQILGMLLQRKSVMLNSHVLNLIFSLVGTIDVGRELCLIPNSLSFQYLLCNFEIWNHDLLKSLFDHIYEIMIVDENHEFQPNIQVLRNMKLVEKILYLISHLNFEYQDTFEIIFVVLSTLLTTTESSTPSTSTSEPLPSPSADLLYFGQFCVSLLYVEAQKDLLNWCLKLIQSTLHRKNDTINVSMCEQVIYTLGFDWLLLFFTDNNTILLSFDILLRILSIPNMLQKFPDNDFNGFWLQFYTIKSPINLLPSSSTEYSSSRQKDDCLLNNFEYLNMLLIKQITLVEIYPLLINLMFGKWTSCNHLTHLDLDQVWNYLWSSDYGIAKVHICHEAVIILLSMCQFLINHENQSKFFIEQPILIVQLLFAFYQNIPEFINLFMTTTIITNLGKIVFPTKINNSIKLINNHPIYEHIMNFIKIVLIDSLSLPISNSKSVPVIDMILNVTSDQVSGNKSVIDIMYDFTYHKYETIYHTEILSIMIDYLMNSNIFMNDELTISIVPLENANNQYILPNICYLSSRIVDQLWRGSLKRDPLDIFFYNVRFIEKIALKSDLNAFYHCLNRTILFLLSRPYNVQDGQVNMIRFLETVLTYENCIFHSKNIEIEFYGCLIYCLLHLISNKKILLITNDSSATWHISNDNDNDNDKIEINTYTNTINQLAIQIWHQIYLKKKLFIDEIFKVSLFVQNDDFEFEVSDQVTEIASKCWQNFIDIERKAATYQYPWEFYQKQKFNLKISKVMTGRLTRLASRSKSKKYQDLQKQCSKITETKMHELIIQNVRLVQDFVRNQQNYSQIEIEYTQKYVYNLWLEIEADLIRERGLWGPKEPNIFNKWLLDLTEGYCRMRNKLIRNHSFYSNYPYMPDQNHTSLKYRYATSFDSKSYYEALKVFQVQNLDNSIESVQFFREESVISRSNNNGDLSHSLPNCDNSLLDDNVVDNSNSSDDIVEDDVASLMFNNQFLFRLLETNEKINYIFRCLRIEGLDNVEALLIFGKECCYIIDGFTILKNREIRDIGKLNDSHKLYEPILPESSTISGLITNQKNVKKTAKIFYEDIREVLKRRYLLQPMAVEMFTCDGRNFLLAFPKNVRNEVFSKFKSVTNSCSIDLNQESISGQKRIANFEQVTNIFSTLMGDTVIQRWIKDEISNFQYLMYINSLTGRSYNDLMQYPIFPWILSDYTSEELDLTNPNIFRDLSKPMGAQTSERLEQFSKRFMEWDDPSGETPPYYYGTHYSSAMIVCSYLVRLEPFTQQFLKLQGGHFDLADRMFHSIEEAWLSASKNNMADVKELIPEFFYLPEFLVNSNNFDFGLKQNGVQLNDVILPPWAKNDPHEFIRIHRMALESDYVSQNLHHWIDLVFGYKQQGQLAAESFNVFHHLFYEGNVDIYNIDDPLKKIATIGFINNFGQIPKQLFHKPHPIKKLSKHIPNRSSSISDNAYLNSATGFVPNKLFYKHIDNLKPSTQPIKELKGRVGQIIPSEKAVFAVHENKCLMPQSFNKYISWGYADHSLRICNYDNDKVVFVHEMVSQCHDEITTAVCPNAKTVITAGQGCYVSVYKYENKKHFVHKKNLYGHTEGIIYLAASSSFNILVSGSKDSTAIVWDLLKLNFIRQLTGHVGPVAAISIQENTGNIATCCATWLHVWDINGLQLASIDTSIGKDIRMQQILCVTFSYCNEWDLDNVIITGSTDGVVKMWSMNLVKTSEIQSNNEHTTKWNRELIFRNHLTMYTAYTRKDNTEPASITALAISKDHRIVYVGDARGRIYSWTVSEVPGRFTADHWCRDEGVEFCTDCQIRFTIYERKHHCRSCGQVFCSKCTSYECKIIRLNILNDVRVCKKCFHSLNEKS